MGQIRRVTFVKNPKNKDLIVQIHLMAKAYGRRPAEWLDPYIIEDDPLMAYQWDRMVFYAGTVWEAEDRETHRPGRRPGSSPRTRRKLSKAEIARIKARSKMSIEDRRKAGDFDDLKGVYEPGIKKVKIPDSGVW